MNKSSSSNLFLRLWNKVLEHWEVRASLLAPLQRHLTGRKKRKKKAACCWWNEILLVQPQRPHFIKCASSHCSHFSWAFWLPEWQQKAPQVAWPSVRFVLYTPPFFFFVLHTDCAVRLTWSFDRPHKPKVDADMKILTCCSTVRPT